jgi:TonB family protein
MNSASTAAPSSSGIPGAEALLAKGYTLTSELAQFCLPAAARDPNRKFAWANSICLLFLTIGCVGLKVPILEIKEPPEIVDVVPVVYTPPPDPTPPPPSDAPPPETDEPVDTTVDMPQILTVAAADPKGVNFAVPVEGPVVVAPNARFASAPPASPPRPPPTPPKPTVFNQHGSGDGGKYPDPTYPRLLREKGIQGKLTLYIIVDASGTVSSAEVKDGSGYGALDKHATQWVKSNWQFPPGQVRHHFVDIIFQLK